MFLVYEPLAGKLYLKILETKTKSDLACFPKTIANEYKNAQLITLVMETLTPILPLLFTKRFKGKEQKPFGIGWNLSTSKSIKKRAKQVEIELNVLTGQFLSCGFTSSPM